MGILGGALLCPPQVPWVGVTIALGGLAVAQPYLRAMFP